MHTYDILANPLYLDDFQYFSTDREDRADFIIDDDDDEGNDNAQSDLVRVVLNLGYLTEEAASKFEFSKNSYSENVKGAIGSNLMDSIHKKHKIN